MAHSTNQARIEITTTTALGAKYETLAVVKSNGRRDMKAERRAGEQAQQLANKRGEKVELHRYQQSGAYVSGEPTVVYPEVVS